MWRENPLICIIVSQKFYNLVFSLTIFFHWIPFFTSISAELQNHFNRCVIFFWINVPKFFINNVFLDISVKSQFSLL